MHVLLKTAWKEKWMEKKKANKNKNKQPTNDNKLMTYTRMAVFDCYIFVVLSSSNAPIYLLASHTIDLDASAQREIKLNQI